MRPEANSDKTDLINSSLRHIDNGLFLQQSHEPEKTQTRKWHIACDTCCDLALQAFRYFVQRSNRRAAQAAFQQQQQQQQQERYRTLPKKSTTSDTKGPQARKSSDNFAGSRSGSAGTTPPPPPHAATPQAPSPILSCGEALAARARDSAAWKKFAETASGSSEVLIGEKQVPWPCQGDDAPLPGHEAMEPQARKVAVRQLQLRWHADKFTQKFGRHLSNVSNQKEATLRRVVAISQALNAIIDKN